MGTRSGSGPASVRLAAVPAQPDLDACRRGDRAAIGAVLAAEGPVLGRLVRRLVGPSADLEDLLQTVFAEAIVSFPRYRGEAPVRSWLCRIAVHVCHDHLGRPDRRRQRSLEALGPQALPEPADGRPLPDEVADDRRRLQALARHLEALPPRRRIAFVLHVVEGYPIHEVAALQGATTVATKSRIFWARRALLARLRADPALCEWLGRFDR